MTTPVTWLAGIGRSTLSVLERAGSVLQFALQALWHTFLPPFYPRMVLRQMVETGYFSLPVVGMTTLFAGMVLALQSYGGLNRTLAEETIPNLVMLAMTRELAPVLAGLMVAGRVGAAIAAEIGTMRVTEQIDALETLSTHPVKYLVVPRVLAGVLMLPLLVLIGDIIGVLGGYLVGVYRLGFNDALYIQRSWEALETLGVISGLVKATCFGFVITLMGTYQGFKSQGGAQGVGAATTYAVVTASILILILNYFVTLAFFAHDA